jgi:short-subunit dehydrogenase
MNGLRKELAHTNVDVHGLDFGPVDTPFWQAAPYAKPTKGIQTTHDVARQILYQLQKTKLTEDHSAKLST